MSSSAASRRAPLRTSLSTGGPSVDEELLPWEDTISDCKTSYNPINVGARELLYPDAIVPEKRSCFPNTPLKLDCSQANLSPNSFALFAANCKASRFHENSDWGSATTWTGSLSSIATEGVTLEAPPSKCCEVPPNHPVQKQNSNHPH